jgi:hypothetical protein
LEEDLERTRSMKQKEKIVTKVERVEVIPHDYEDL